MDVREEIRRLTATADILRKFPELGDPERFRTVEPMQAFYTGYPSDKLGDLLHFLHDNEIEFAVEAEGSTAALRIRVAGILYWFTNIRAEDLDEKATMILVGETPEDIAAVEGA